MIENLPIVGHERVCCYITRRFEILVFEYDQVYDDARIGTHIINGCKKEDETLEQSVVRKIFEESGLRLENPVFVGISEWESTLEQWKGQDLEQWKGQQQIRHYFWLEAPLDTPDSWSHTVLGGELNQGMICRFRFTPIKIAQLDFEFGEMLEELIRYLQKEIAKMIYDADGWLGIDMLSAQEVIKRLKGRVQYPQVIDLVFDGYFSKSTEEEMAMSIFYYHPTK